MAIRVMGPPPDLRTGCDLVIEFPLILELEVQRILSDSRIQPIQSVPVQDTLLSPVSLFQTRDYGDYLMVTGSQYEADHSQVKPAHCQHIRRRLSGCALAGRSTDRKNTGRCAGAAASGKNPVRLRPSPGLGGNAPAMSWLIVGTVPRKDFPLTCGQAVLKIGTLS